MDEKEFQAILLSIASNQCGKELILIHKKITDAQAIRLAEALAKNACLHSLLLGGNQITDAGAGALSEALTKNACLHSLFLNDNQISGTRALSEALAKNTCLRTLNLNGNQITDAGASALSQSLIKNTCLHTLHLRGNQITDAGASALSQALVKNACLGTLDLGGNGIMDAGASALSEALAKNVCLHTLHLGSNKIKDAGVSSLSDALAKNASLHTLDLGGNQITDAGTNALSGALAKNACLLNLYLYNNQISDAGTSALSEALVKNTCLHSLYLNNNQITDAGASALSQALVKNVCLHTLHLGGNQITDAGASVLSEALAKNTRLHNLQLYRNKITDAGASALSEALAKNASLHKFELYGNKISDKPLDAIDEALKQRRVKAQPLHEKDFEEIVKQLEQLLALDKAALNKVGKINFLKHYQKLYVSGNEHTDCLMGLHSKGLHYWEQLNKLRDSCEITFNQIEAPFASPKAEAQTMAQKLKEQEEMLKRQREEFELQKKAQEALLKEQAAELGKKQAQLEEERKKQQEKPKEETKKQQEKLVVTPSLPTIPRIAWKELTLGDLVGNGSFGDVYKGKLHGFTVAIKQLQLKTLPAGVAKEFEHESDMMMKCQFPSIVRLLGVCTEPGHFAMVMEYLPCSLRQRLQEDKCLSLLKRLGVALEIAQGLSFLHSHQIVHRDLKSLNILLDENDHAKIADFGLAKVKLEVGSTSTKSHKVVGSVRWRAPELFKRNAVPSFATDVYSLGMLLWELITGQLPYSDAADEQTVISWLKDGEQEKIPETCNKELAELIQACWAAPEKRPTAIDVATRLELIIEVERNAAKEALQETKVEAEKSWHFDSSLKPAPGAMKGEYILIPAGEKDAKKVMKIYNQSPIPGYEISSVQVIYNPTFNRNFSQKMHLLQQRFGKAAFASNWHKENESEWRAAVHSMFETMAEPHQDKDYPAVKINFLWHATNLDILPSLFETGFANVSKKTDVGFFGKADFYGTPDAWYAHKVYFKGAMLLTCTSHFSLYPVIDGDMDKLTGGPKKENYDVHGAPVVPATADIDEGSYIPFKRGQTPTCSEIAVFDGGQVIPRYVVGFQKTLLASPSVSPVATPQGLLYAYLASQVKPKPMDKADGKKVLVKVAV